MSFNNGFEVLVFSYRYSKDERDKCFSLCRKLRSLDVLCAYVDMDCCRQASIKDGVDILPFGLTSNTSIDAMIEYHIKRYRPRTVVISEVFDNNIITKKFPGILFLRMENDATDQIQETVESKIVKQARYSSSQKAIPVNARSIHNKIRFSYYPVSQCSVSYVINELGIALSNQNISVSLFPLPANFCSPIFLTARKMLRETNPHHAQFIQGIFRNMQYTKADVDIIFGIHTKEARYFLPFAPKTEKSIVYVTGHGKRDSSIVNYINSRFNGIWSPSQYVSDAFVDAGYSQEKIFTIPHGVDVQIAKEHARRHGNEKRGNFIFLQTSYPWIQVKGFDLTLEAFIEEFSKEENVKLIIKTCPVPDGTHKLLESMVREAMSKCRGQNRILYLCKYMKTNDHYQLYRDSNVLVHPCRAEGFGICILEAIACGLPVIVTDKGGHTEFCFDGKALPIVSRNLDSSKRMVSPDIGHLKMLMRYSYENYSMLQNKALQRLDYIHHRWSWQAAAKKAIASIQRIMNE